MLTTYKHDYAPPVTNKYRFLKSQAKPVEKEADGRKIQLAQTNLRAKWIGIAKKGRLIDPRVISKIPDEDVIQPRTFQGEENNCMVDQPNRFLRVLRTAYPDLHTKLANMPGNDDAERLKSTYQINYCHISEYPDGIYEAKKTGNNILKPLKLVDVCNEYKTGEQCIQSFKPETDINFEKTDKHPPEKLHKKSDNTSHWSAEEKTRQKSKLREYVNSISKLGCVVQKNSINDHQRCEKEKEPCIERLKECDKIK